MPLDKKPKLELTRRQVVERVGKVLGDTASFAPPETIFEALDFIMRTKALNHEVWSGYWKHSVDNGKVILLDRAPPS